MTSTPSRAERTAFVLANTRLKPVPHAEAIRLHLADEAIALWNLTEEAMGKIGLPPPFWAFAWAGGQALARHLLVNPALVAGQKVLDFASGSGLVAIAAALGGARAVDASEIDPFAAAAIAVNAAANGLALRVIEEDVIGRDDGWDVVLVGDVFYERDLAARIIPWLDALDGRGARVLVGDPGRSYLPRSRLTPIAHYEVPLVGALEDSEIKRTAVWRLVRAAC